MMNISYTYHPKITQHLHLLSRLRICGAILLLPLYAVDWNANLMQLGNFIDVFLARHISVHTPIIRSIRCWFAAYGFLHRVFGWVVVLRGAVYGADGAVHGTIRTVHSDLLSGFQDRHPSKNHMLQLNIYCSWWWAYVPETCRAKNTSIELPSCIKLAFQFISWGRRTVKKPSICLHSLRRVSFIFTFAHTFNLYLHFEISWQHHVYQFVP